MLLVHRRKFGEELCAIHPVHECGSLQRSRVQLGEERGASLMAYSQVLKVCREGVGTAGGYVCVAQLPQQRDGPPVAVFVARIEDVRLDELG